MEQRDLIKEEIERLGQAIGRLIALVIGTGGNNPANWSPEAEISSGLVDGLGVDLRQLLDFSAAELRAFSRKRKLTPHHVELLARLFAEWAENEIRNGTRLQLAERALLLYDLSAELSGVYCFSRANREQELRELIKSIQA